MGGTDLVDVDEDVVELGKLLAAHARHHLLVMPCNDGMERNAAIDRIGLSELLRRVN